MRRQLVGFAALLLTLPVAAQKPSIFNISDVVIGAKRTPTRYLYAVGKWSDAGELVSALSTEIQCYKALGFCAVASADWNGAQATVNLSTFDILRWDDKEIIAVDSSPICVVNTLRADLAIKAVTLGSTEKGATKDPVCKAMDKMNTSVLLGEKDVKREIGPGSRKK